MQKQLIVPESATEDEERKFWAEINLADYYDPSDARLVVFPNLKPKGRYAKPYQVKQVRNVLVKYQLGYMRGGIVLTDYLSAAMRHAHYEILEDDGAFYGEIPECRGAYANPPTLEECRAELTSVVLLDFLAGKGIAC